MSPQVKSVAPFEEAVHIDPLPTEDVLKTVLRFIEWLETYGEVSYDFQSFFSSDLTRAAKALYYKKPFLETLALAIPDRLRRYQHVFSLEPGEKVDGLFQDGLIGPDTGDEILSCWREFVPLLSETDELGGFQFLELRSTLPDELLMYADKLSMAHSLEARVPYLDKEIVEFTEGLPANFKVRNGSRKWLNRQVCQAFLPAKIMRRKKRGFAGNVVDDWFRSAKHQKMENILLDKESHIYKYLQPQVVREMFNQHETGRSDNHKILFSLIVFEEWLRFQHGSRN